MSRSRSDSIDATPSAPVLPPADASLCSTSFAPIRSLLALPPEVLLQVLSWLSIDELRAARLVCRLFWHLADDNSLWRAVFEKHCGLGRLLTQPSWRQEYYLVAGLLGRQTFWHGVSKWVEPKGHGKEQETVCFLTFHKFSGDISGRGNTNNFEVLHDFTITGQRTSVCEFWWDKKFSDHTTRYEGRIDFEALTLQGKLTYDDGERVWRGLFRYELSDPDEHWDDVLGDDPMLPDEEQDEEGIDDAASRGLAPPPAPAQNPPLAGNGAVAQALGHTAALQQSSQSSHNMHNAPSAQGAESLPPTQPDAPTLPSVAVNAIASSLASALLHTLSRKTFLMVRPQLRPS